MALQALTGAGNVTTANNGAASSITVNKPANTADGDLLVAFVYFRNSAGTITTPAGWTALGPANTVDETFVAYYKPIPTASAEAATTYVFSSSAGSSRTVGVIFRVTGANLTTPLDAAGVQAAHTGTSSLALPEVTAASTRALLLSFEILNTSTTTTSAFTAPTGMTEVAQDTAVGAAATATVQVAQQSLTATGGTGSRTATISPTAANSGGFMVTIVNGTPAPASTVSYMSLSASTGWTPTGGTAVGVLADTDGATLLTATAPSGLHLTGTLGALTPPTAGTNVTLTLTVDKIGATTGSVTAKLLEGATVRSTQTVSAIPNGTAGAAVTGTVTVTFPAADVAAVTNWDALTLDLSFTAA